MNESLSPAIFAQADGIIDLRCREDYEALHLVDSTWLSWELLPERLNALPAAPASFFLVGSHAQIEAASIFLDSKGYAVIGSLVADDSVRLAAWQPHLPGWFTSGKQSKSLWSATPLIKAFIEGDLLPSHSASKPQKRLQVLDLGCGGGRDAVYLAQQKMHVLGIDREARVIKRAKGLAQLSGAQVRFKVCDLKKSDCMPKQNFDVICMLRYLNRDLLTSLPEQVNPQGYVIIQTFVQPAAGEKPLFSPTNPNFILQIGELAKVFAEWRVIVDRIEFLADGRPVQSFIAQKMTEKLVY